MDAPERLLIESSIYAGVCSGSIWPNVMSRKDLCNIISIDRRLKTDHVLCSFLYANAGNNCGIRPAVKQGDRHNK